MINGREFLSAFRVTSEKKGLGAQLQQIAEAEQQILCIGDSNVLFDQLVFEEIQ